MEYLQVVYLAGDQTERRGLRIEIDGTFFGAVKATQVNHKLVVDEYPNIVITAESEHFATFITKRYNSFAGKMPIVRHSGKLETFITKTEGRVNGVEIGVVVDERRAIAGEWQLDIGGEIDAGGVSVPSIEIGGAGKWGKRGSVGAYVIASDIHGFEAAIGLLRQVFGDDAGPHTSDLTKIRVAAPLKVGMAFGKVPHAHGQRICTLVARVAAGAAGRGEIEAAIAAISARAISRAPCPSRATCRSRAT